MSEGVRVSRKHYSAWMNKYEYRKEWCTKGLHTFYACEEFSNFILSFRCSSRNARKVGENLFLRDSQTMDSFSHWFSRFSPYSLLNNNNNNNDDNLLMHFFRYLSLVFRFTVKPFNFIFGITFWMKKQKTKQKNSLCFWQFSFLLFFFLFKFFFHSRLFTFNISSVHSNFSWPIFFIDSFLSPKLFFFNYIHTYIHTNIRIFSLSFFLSFFSLFVYLFLSLSIYIYIYIFKYLRTTRMWHKVNFVNGA